MNINIKPFILESNRMVQFSDKIVTNSINVDTPTNKPTEIPSSPYYPLLHSLGVKTDFDSNQEQVVNLMSELVAVFNKA